jgi:hypothetical protein
VANQKQRRRREKEMRHGIEIVEIDEDGNERVVERSELRPAEPPARVKGSVKGGKPAGGGKPVSKRGVPQPPSWKRAGKRAAIFGPLFFAFILLTNRKGNVAGQVITALILIALFVPMSYYMDRFAYRMYQKRLGKEPTRRGRR